MCVVKCPMVIILVDYLEQVPVSPNLTWLHNKDHEYWGGLYSEGEAAGFEVELGNRKINTHAMNNSVSRAAIIRYS